MNILFFTPTLLSSAIGRVASMVVEDLVRLGHQVTVISSQAESLFAEPLHSFTCPTVFWNEYERIWSMAHESDLVVYQIGDNFQYHRGCMEWLPSLTGIVSLHDNFLGHLFWAWSDLNGRDKASELMVRIYGQEVADVFFNHADSQSFIQFSANRAPMTEWIVSMASAVIVHSSWALPRIIKASLGPVKVMPLPYNAPYLETRTVASKNSNEHGRSKKIIVLTVGHVNANKRYSNIIEAIGQSELLREKVQFRIVGAAEDAMQQALTKQATDSRVQLHMTGQVDDKALGFEIQQADVMCCLRWPALESASASTIEAMLYGKPILVTDTGFYQDLPDSCVLKVKPDDEINDIIRHLELMVSDPQLRSELGAIAQHYAMDTFRSDKYASCVVEMKGKILRGILIQQEGQKILNTLSKWGARGHSGMISALASSLSIIK